MRAFEASGFRTCVCENIDLRTICDVTHQAHTAASTKIGFSASTKKMYTCRLMSDSTQTSFRTVKVKHATVATRLKKRITFLRERGTLMLRSSQRDSPVSRFEMPKVNTKLFRRVYSQFNPQQRSPLCAHILTTRGGKLTREVTDAIIQFFFMAPLYSETYLP